MENEAIITGLYMRKTHKKILKSMVRSQVKIHEK